MASPVLSYHDVDRKPAVDDGFFTGFWNALPLSCALWLIGYGVWCWLS